MNLSILQCVDYMNAMLNFVVQTIITAIMGRAKGTHKTGGRVKGTPNKTSAEQKEWILDFLSKGSVVIDKFWDDPKTTRKEKIELYAAIAPKFASFVMAKQTDTKVTFDEEVTKAIKESSDKVNALFKGEQIKK